jgi:MFS family permease
MDRASARPLTIQFLAGAATFSSIIFIPNYAGHVLGATDFQVGIIVFSFAMAAFWASYFFGRLADVRGRRGVLKVGLGLASLASLTQIVAPDPWTLAVSRALVGITIGMFPAALLAYAHETRQPLGRFVSMGSLGWGVGSLLAGIVSTLPDSEALGVRLVFALSSVLFALAFLLVLRMPFPKHTSISVPMFPVDVIRRNLSVYASILVRHTGANMIWVIFPLYLEDALYIPKDLIGVLYLTNTLTQFTFMMVMDRFRSDRLVAVGLLAAAMTFFLFTLARNFWEMLPIQVLLGFSWSSLYVGSLRYVMERSVERATSTGILGSAINLSQAIGPLLGGVIAFTYGRVGVMYAASAMALAALLIFLSTTRGVLSPRETPVPGS